MRKLMLVFGTRPEAVKMAPLVLALREAADFRPVVAVTAQHRSMLDQVLRLFEITPDFDLDLNEDRQTLTSVTSRALDGLSPLIEEESPDMVVVQGDTTTTFVGALAAFYHRVPVVHVEAGLRTGNNLSPYPEEINRRLTTQLSSLHLAPTTTSRNNLVGEGVDKASIVVTGNTVIDALLWTVDRRVDYEDPALDALADHTGPVLLVTAHRRESWGGALVGVGQALADIALARPDVLVIFPIHRNPVVREAIMPALVGLDNVIVVEPMPYGSFARLMERSTLILTDSGGVQEEGPSLGKPVLVMRDTTERPEAIAAGTVRLVGTDRDRVRDSVLELLRDKAAYDAMARAVNPYGDGEACGRVLAAIRHYFDEGPAPDQFPGSVSVSPQDRTLSPNPLGRAG